MNGKLTITIEPADAELIQRMEHYRRNGDWLTEHGAALFGQHRGKFIAIAEGEVFVAGSRQEVESLAQVKHPGDEPFVQYIPKEKSERIYAY